MDNVPQVVSLRQFPASLYELQWRRDAEQRQHAIRRMKPVQPTSLGMRDSGKEEVNRSLESLTMLLAFM
jgi:hypothetical protein